MSLILTRRENESIEIGPNIRVTVHRLSAGNVRLAIEAPKETPIKRSELPSLPERGEVGG